MISIRDEDHARLIRAKGLLEGKPSTFDLTEAWELLGKIEMHILDLMQQAPTQDPRIVPLTEDDMRRSYPERYEALV